MNSYVKLWSPRVFFFIAWLCACITGSSACRNVQTWGLQLRLGATTLSISQSELENCRKRGAFWKVKFNLFLQRIVILVDECNHHRTIYKLTFTSHVLQENKHDIAKQAWIHMNTSTILNFFFWENTTHITILRGYWDGLNTRYTVRSFAPPVARLAAWSARILWYQFLGPKVAPKTLKWIPLRKMWDIHSIFTQFYLNHIYITLKIGLKKEHKNIFIFPTILNTDFYLMLM